MLDTQQETSLSNMAQTTEIKDSKASPYIEQKGVILCRSGIQYYSYNEVVKALGEPPVKKDYYKEYRPANVVVKAQDKCGNLPVTKEHPDVWVTPDNWDTLCGGVTGKEVSVVALDGEAEGEIGIKGDLTFYTRKLHDYYEKHKEVSLGYTCKKHYVDNPDEVGYDILLDEITEVNHLAITRAGRGGSSVAVIDSIIGGLKPMRTGIFAYLASKIQKDSEPTSFGKTVLDAVKNSKGTTEEELAGEMKGVLDSISELKDCESKDTLLNVVKDCFDNKEKAIANEEELTATLDAMWVDIHSDSLGEIAKAFAKLGKKPEAPATNADTEPQNKDSDPDNKDKGKKDEANKDGDPDDKDKGKKDEEANKDGDPDNKKNEKDGCNKDSASAVATKDDILAVIKDALPELVQSAVKDVLGIKTSDSQPAGIVNDSATNSEADSGRDYASFID